MVDGNLLISTVQWALEKLEEYISPIIVMPCYESGVLLRLGKYKYNLKEGVNWKIPFFDKTLTVVKEIDTFHVSPVDVTTKDKQQISIEPIIKFKIVDPKKYLIDTNQAEGNIHDISRGVIADYLTDFNWEDINKKPTTTAIKNALKRECEDMGIEVLKVYFGRIVTTKIHTVYGMEVSVYKE